jgi:hypothetical protein
MASIPEPSIHYHLVSVAANTLGWWEKHRYDLEEDGDKWVFRYREEPDFVAHARELYAKFSSS